MYTDIRAKCLPKALALYGVAARWDRPVGILLPLYGPIWVMLGIMGVSFSWLKHSLVFFVGGFLARSAACLINDLWDKDIDPHVTRTQQRPIANGTLSVEKACLHITVYLICATCLVVIYNIWISSISIAILMTTYPLAKRFTYWPQLWLGVTYQAGIWAVYEAFSMDLLLGPIIVYIACIAWTIGYDTIYACADREDDAKIGVYSTARKFGDHVKLMVAITYGIFFAALSIVYVAYGIAYYICLLIAATIVYRGLYTCEVDKPETCIVFFRKQVRIGAVITCGMVLGRFFSS